VPCNGPLASGPRARYFGETPALGRCYFLPILYINCLVCASVCIWRGFGGWGRERPVKQRATTTVSAPTRCTNQDWSPQSIAAVQREGMTVGSHPSPTTPEVDIKTFPSAPHYRKNRRLYRGACFRKFSKTFGNQGSKCQNWGFGFSHPPRVRE
jgi:hypothetical protein